MLTISSPKAQTETANDPHLALDKSNDPLHTPSLHGTKPAPGVAQGKSLDATASRKRPRSPEESRASDDSPDNAESGDTASTSSFSSSNGQLGHLSEQQGPLIASLGANGEHQEDTDQQSSNESEEALIARHTDLLAPKAAVPELRDRAVSEPGRLRTAPPQDVSNVNPNGPHLPMERGGGSSLRNGHSGSQPPTLGPMEPIEPMSSLHERKRLPPLNSVFPSVPGFTGEDPGANTIVTDGPDFQGKPVHNLPSLVENSRQLSIERDRNGSATDYRPVSGNAMAEIYAPSTTGAAYMPGVPLSRSHDGSFSGVSPLSGWGNGGVAGSYTARNRDPRFSYTYPHGMLSGPAGIIPESIDHITALQTPYGQTPAAPTAVAPPASTRTQAAVPQSHVLAPGMPYQTSPGDLPMMAADPLQHQPSQHPPQAQQPLSTTTYPMLFSPQQAFPQLSLQYAPPGRADGLPSHPLQLPHMLREADATSQGMMPAAAMHPPHGKTGTVSARHSAQIGTEPRVFRCTHPGCDWSFVRSSDQKRHIRSHEKPSLRCPYWDIHSNCNLKGGLFYRLDVLKRHLRLVHLKRPDNGSDDGGVCRICDRQFEHTRDFVNHCDACAEEARNHIRSLGQDTAPA